MVYQMGAYAEDGVNYYSGKIRLPHHEVVE